MSLVRRFFYQKHPAFRMMALALLWLLRISAWTTGAAIILYALIYAL